MPTFNLNLLNSPTYHNLCLYLNQQKWHKTSDPADFSEENFQFDLRASEQLEFKDLLAELTQKCCKEVMPLTYCIHDENWQTILNQAALTPVKVWILKPALLNNGQHIHLFQHLDQLKEHYLSSNRLGGNHVLQEYITPPHLLKGPSKGHKYSIRMFVVLTNYHGAYIYPKGYFNIALKPYEANDFNQLGPHLTNEHLHEDILNVVQIPTQQYDLFQPFYPKIQAITHLVIQALKQNHPKAFIGEKNRTLAIFGFDFMVDAKDRVWLLEANHGPCFPTTPDHPLQNSLYKEFWKDFIKSFVEPIAEDKPVDQIQYASFERL